MACGSTLKQSRSAGSVLGDGTYPLLECPGCGSARTDGEPPAPPAGIHVGGAYEPARGLAGALIAPLRALGEMDRMRSFTGLAPGARVLEIGCGDGSLAAALADRGCEVVGIEPEGGARDRARARGIEVIGGEVEDADFAESSFDAVVAWHSLEHLERPDLALGRTHSWLRPGGALIAGVPNLASLQARIGGDGWFHQDVPRHRWHLTATGARSLFERTGFEISGVRHWVLEQNPLGMWQTLLNRLTRRRNVAFRALKRDPALGKVVGGQGPAADLAITAVAALPLAVTAVALEAAAATARRGGTIAITARRR